MLMSGSQMNLPYNSTQHTTPSPPPGLDMSTMDDIPLSQRKELMRQNSRVSVNSTTSNNMMMTGAMRQTRRISSGSAAKGPGNNINSINTLPSQTVGQAPAPNVPTITAESTNFDSHQPQRHANLPSQAARDARLSHFRQSVAAELRTPPAAIVAQRSSTQVLRTSSSGIIASATAMNNKEVSRVLEHQRNMLLEQREMEAQRLLAERWEKEERERAFEEMMRRGDLVDVHREALRKMQGGVKH